MSKLLPLGTQVPHLVPGFSSRVHFRKIIGHALHHLIPMLICCVCVNCCHLAARVHAWCQDFLQGCSLGKVLAMLWACWIQCWFLMVVQIAATWQPGFILGARIFFSGAVLENCWPCLEPVGPNIGFSWLCKMLPLGRQGPCLVPWFSSRVQVRKIVGHVMTLLVQMLIFGGCANCSHLAAMVYTWCQDFIQWRSLGKLLAMLWTCLAQCWFVLVVQIAATWQPGSMLSARLSSKGAV